MGERCVTKVGFYNCKVRPFFYTFITICYYRAVSSISGLIDFDQFEGNNVLVAQREGAANCMTTLKLKDDFTFKEQSICFSVTENNGNYHLQNDTIYFDNVSVGVHEDKFYEFAVIEPSKFDKSGKYFELIRYKNLTDTVGHSLWITKNELNKLKTKAKPPTSVGQ